MMKQKAQHKSGTWQCLPKVDTLKYWFAVVTVSIPSPEYCEKAHSYLFKNTNATWENINNDRWVTAIIQ